MAPQRQSYGGGSLREGPVGFSKTLDDNGTLLLTMGEANPPRPNTPKPVVAENPDDKPNPNAPGRRTASG